MKKIIILLTLLILITLGTFPQDNRYNENMNMPQDIGGGGNVSPQTGSLTISSADIALPSMNGLNFEVNRTYSSN